MSRPAIIVSAKPTSLRLAYALGTLLPAIACLRPGAYACEDASQCQSAPDGACIEGWCAFPNEDCASGMRFGDHAPTDVANACVVADSGDVTDGSSSLGGSSGEPVDDDPPVSLCGNNVVDPQEECDDGNRLAGDACHPQCVLPGTILWTATYDGEAHSDDRGFGVAVDPDGVSFWVAGYTVVDPAEGFDLLLQRRWVEDGSLVWTRSHAGDAHGEDIGEGVALDGDGRPWLVGMQTSAATSGDIWVGGYERDGTRRLAFTHDEQGRIDHGHGLAFTDSGTLVVVGTVDVGASPDAPDDAAWIRRFDDTGQPQGDAIVRNGSTSLDAALQVVHDVEGFVVSGDLSTADRVEEVWTARYDGGDVLAWEQFGTADDVGPYPRGVGVAPDGAGGWATAGVLSSNIWVQRYAADGTPGLNIIEVGDNDSHDEGADVAFLPDGRFIVVGFIDFATVGFATGNAWVRAYQADGTPEWTDVFEGASEETDKALAVGLTDKYSAIVVGYETVPGQSRDVWMRHYAL